MNKIIVLFIAAYCAIDVYGQNEIRNLSLNDAVKTALRNNPEIRSALAVVSATDGRFWSGISLPQPEIGVNYEYTPVNKNLGSASEKSFEIKQSFEFPSNYFLKGSRLGKESGISLNKLVITERSVIKRIKTAYFKILLKEKQLKFAEENLRIAYEFNQKAEIKLNTGESTSLEKLTAGVQLSEAENNTGTAKNELMIAYAELDNVLGPGRDSNAQRYKLTDSLVFIEYDFSAEKMYTVLNDVNPRLKIAELQNSIAVLDKGLAWSSLLPNINVAYYKQSRDGENGFYGASIGISVPLWFMFEQRGKIQEAAANELMTKSDLTAARSEVLLKLKTAAADRENSLKQVKLYKDKILPQAEEIFKTASGSYNAGELSYLEYLQAKQTMISARNNFINSVFNNYLAVFEIEEITGQSIIGNYEPER